MKKFVFLLLIISALADPLHIANAQWFYQNNTDSAKSITSSSFINSNTGWFAGVNGRITKTTDGGITWNTIYFDNNTIFSVKFFNSNTGIACGTSGKIFKSTDGGINWIQQNSLTSDTLRALDFLDENTGWCAGTHIILKTTNGGNQWVRQNIDTSIVNPRLYSLKMYDNQNGLAGGKDPVKSHYSGFIFRTSNGGNNWIFVDSLSGYTYNESSVNSINYVTQNTVYSSVNGKFYKSTDSGIQWNYISFITIGNYSCLQFKDINTGWAICGSALLKTTNGGNNWIEVVSSAFEPNIYSSLSYISGNILIASKQKGLVIKSLDEGLTWGNYSIIPNSDIYSLKTIDANTVFVSGEGGMLFKTIDGGIIWKQKFRNYLGSIRGPFFANQNTGYCINSEAYVYKTTDAGENWFQTGLISPPSFLNGFCVNENTLWVVGSSSVLRSTNSGDNWVNKSPDTSSSTVFVWIRESSNMVLLSSANKLFKSTNSGDNWIDLQLDSLDIWKSIYFKDSQTGWIIMNNNSSYCRFYKTTDGGDNWTKYYYTVDPANVPRDFVFVNDNTGYSVTGGPSILKTTDGGFNWFISQTMSSFIAPIRVSFVDENTGWIAGWYGIICKTTNGGTSFIMKNGSTIPENFHLFQNYPNPFNPVTKIRFDIPSEGKSLKAKVKILVYDILGKEIATLVNEQLQPGTYEVTFDGSQLPSGVYFYQLRAGEFSETKKMILLK
jgi:photosystem II stability/assembly factor-like uncharacterized protein